MFALLQLLIEHIGLSKESAMAFGDQSGQLEVQRHAMYCLWMMDQGKVNTPRVGHGITQASVQRANRDAGRLAAEGTEFSCGSGDVQADRARCAKSERRRTS